MQTLVDAICAYHGKTKLLLQAFVFGVGVHAFNNLIYVCAAQALGVELSVGTVFFGSSLQILATLVPASINGIGLREAAAVALYTRMGVPRRWRCSSHRGLLRRDVRLLLRRADLPAPPQRLLPDDRGRGRRARVQGPGGHPGGRGRRQAQARARPGHRPRRRPPRGRPGRHRRGPGGLLLGRRAHRPLRPPLRRRGLRHLLRLGGGPSAWAWPGAGASRRTPWSSA